MSQSEEFKVSGKELVDKVKDLIHQGNIRRIIIKNEEGISLFELPVTAAAVGVLLAAPLAAVAAIAAMVSNCTIVVEKRQ